ncbi:hypothetical protein [Petrachloros mirabilis]
MTNRASSLWSQASRALMKSFPGLYELEPGGPLVLELGSEGWLLEIKPEGKLLCQYGVTIDDVMSLMSDGTPEDLGTDEVAKQAKYFIQPAVSKYRPLLLQSGFSEHTEMNAEYVAVTFERLVDFQNLPKVEELMRWCCRELGVAK